MSTIEKATALGAYLAALGIPAASSAYCIPILTGEKPVPTAVESALAETAASVADGITVTLVEAAKRKGVSRSTIFRMTKDGTLTPVCIRGKNRIRLGDLDRAFRPRRSSRGKSAKRRVVAFCPSGRVISSPSPCGTTAEHRLRMVDRGRDIGLATSSARPSA